MLILNPPKLTLLGVRYEAIESVAIDRLAHREVIEWCDAGPHAVFADVPEIRTDISIVQRLDTDTLDTPRPGDSGALEIMLRPNSSDAARRTLSAQVVVRSVRLSAGEKPKRTISLVALSPDGATDPLA